MTSTVPIVKMKLAEVAKIVHSKCNFVYFICMLPVWTNPVLESMTPLNIYLVWTIDINSNLSFMMFVVNFPKSWRKANLLLWLYFLKVSKFPSLPGPAKFFSVTFGLQWQLCLKKIQLPVDFALGISPSIFD